MNPNRQFRPKPRPENRLPRMPAPWETCPEDALACGDCMPDQVKDLKQNFIDNQAKATDYARRLNVQQYRMENNKMLRRLQHEKEERHMQECMCKVEKEQCKRDAQVYQETAFAHAIDQMKNEKTVKDAIRRQMYNCTPEIRELERQIRRGYYAKTLHAQRLEGEVLKIEEKIRDMECDEMMEDAIRQYDQKEEEKYQEECTKKRECLRTLMMQMKDKAKRDSLKKAEEEMDKRMVDDIVENIKREEIEDLEEMVEKRKLYQSEMDAAKRARDEFRRKEQERIEEEERIRQQYVAQKRELEAKIDQAKADREARKASIAAMTTQRLLDEQYKKAEFEEIQFELIEEELAEQVRRKEAEDAAAQEKMRRELQEAMKEAMRLRQEKLEAERKDNEEFRRMMMAKFAEDERLEQLTNQKRREKEREHRKKVEAMIIENRARRADEREKDYAMSKCLEAFSSSKDDFYEQERLRLLREHGPKLLGFLPRGLIRNNEELKKLGEPFLSYYANLKKEPHPSTVDLEPCEEELLRNFTISGSNKR